MKLTPKLAIAILLLPASPILAAEEHDHDHDHDHEHEHDEDIKKGENGGQIVDTKQGLILEVVVDKDRKAHIYLLDKENKAQAIGTHAATGIAGERSSPTKLTFSKAEGAEKLVSDVALPAGAHVNMLLQIKSSADAKPIIARFELHLH